jgi:hypothetical protein
MKTLLLALSMLCLSSVGYGQGRYSTRSGLVVFFSATPIEDIDARNSQVAAVLDMGSGQVAFTVPVKSFQFKRTLMQEHFNENYMESDKFPQATFAGRVVDFQPALLQNPGPQNVLVEGDLTIHGTRRRVKVPGTLELKNNQLLVTSKFSVAPADYSIEIPLLVRENIAKTVSVSVALTCVPLTQLQAVK